jgi:flagellar hook protein FlgE
MSLSSAMYTGVSGLLNNGQAMNVIGNNISNVNSTGFKAGRTLFSDLLSENVSTTSQVGTGVKTQAIQDVFTQGSTQSSENITDLAIQGNSFFALKSPTVATGGQDTAYLSRAGAFTVNKDLTLVNPDGYQVLDTSGQPIKFSDNAAGIASSVTALATAAASAQTALTTDTGTVTTAMGTTPNVNQVAALAALTSANTTLANALTALTAAPNAANAKVAGDAVAAAHAALETAATSAALPLTDLAANNGTATPVSQVAIAVLATVGGLATTAQTDITTDTAAYQAKLDLLHGSPAFVATQLPAIYTPTAPEAAAYTSASAGLAALTAANATLGTAVTTFGATPTQGNATALQAAVAAAHTALDAAAPAAGLTLSALSSDIATPVLGANNSVASVATDVTTVVSEQAKAFSKITNIDTSGLISYLGGDGQTQCYYTASGVAGTPVTTASTAASATYDGIAIVTAKDPAALTKVGGSLYRSTIDSGVSASAFSQSSNRANSTSEQILSNSLEQSNVDMASEFVRMIVTQRAYSANSKTITTTDQMTQEVLGLIR